MSDRALPNVYLHEGAFHNIATGNNLDGTERPDVLWFLSSFIELTDGGTEDQATVIAPESDELAMGIANARQAILIASRCLDSRPDITDADHFQQHGTWRSRHTGAPLVQVGAHLWLRREPRIVRQPHSFRLLPER